MMATHSEALGPSEKAQALGEVIAEALNYSLAVLILLCIALLLRSFLGSRKKRREAEARAGATEDDTTAP